MYLLEVEAGDLNCHSFLYIPFGLHTIPVSFDVVMRDFFLTNQSNTLKKLMYSHLYIKGPDWSKGNGESEEAKWNIKKAVSIVLMTSNKGFGLGYLN
jgi:hypothetical protein